MKTKRQWKMGFAPLLTEALHHREQRRGAQWFLDEVCVEIGGQNHWLFLAKTDALEDAWPLAGRR